ncbi:hypothetical protein [Hydrogenophaga crocea]|uniref:Uncharacterized protein n=1 Tax=Hydrogenophaga crocea TaxID=2716225 RepID=A0A6G8IEW4_9BURK|nr:hypothetical protein [Hydrogenophaga crocea]QIM51585.1 hypothetical protein G9Q37_05255 [Hydrogenophaga crocea]
MSTILTDDERRQAIQSIVLTSHGTADQIARAVEAAVLAKLAQQAPVAWMREGWGPDCGPYVEFYRDDEMGVLRERKDFIALYTHPAPQQADRQRVPDVQDMLECLAADIEAIGVMHRGSPSYEHDAHWMRSKAAKAVRDLAAMLAAAPEAPAQADEGDVVVCWNHDRTRILAVTRQNVEGQILKVIAEAPTQAEAPSEREKFCAWFKLKYLRAPHGGDGQPDLGLWQVWQARAALASQPQAAIGHPKKLWLWRNHVGGRPEYWAFDNPYPKNLENADPQTVGQPCGYAIFKPSRDGSNGRTEDQVLKEMTSVRASQPQAEAKPVAPYCYVYEYDGVFGLHREFYPSEWNGREPDRTIPLYLHPPTQASEQERRDAERCQRALSILVGSWEAGTLRSGDWREAKEALAAIDAARRAGGAG